MIQEIKYSGFVTYLLDGVLYFLVLSKIFLASQFSPSQHLKLSLSEFLKNLLIVAFS